MVKSAAEDMFANINKLAAVTIANADFLLGLVCIKFLPICSSFNFSLVGTIGNWPVELPDQVTLSDEQSAVFALGVRRMRDANGEAEP